MGIGTFGRVYSGTLLSEDDREMADQEIFVKTITGKIQGTGGGDWYICRVYSGTLLSEDDREVANQEIFVKTITGKICVCVR